MLIAIDEGNKGRDVLLVIVNRGLDALRDPHERGYVLFVVVHVGMDAVRDFDAGGFGGFGSRAAEVRLGVGDVGLDRLSRLDEERVDFLLENWADVVSWLAIKVE